MEEHHQLLVQPSWKHILNYETRWMTREQLTIASYDAAENLNRLKLKYGRIDQDKGDDVTRRIERARALNGRLDAIEQGREV